MAFSAHTQEERPMPRRLTAVLATVALLASFMTTSVVQAASTPNATACANRANRSADLLLPCIRTDDLWAYMQAFQAIADANPGPDGHASRNSGEPGYRASVDYVANLMTQWGYAVTIQPYTFDYFAFQGTPSLSQNSPNARSYTLVSEWNPGKSLGSTTADVQPSAGIVIPSPGGTSAGCDPSDFNGFVAGRVALIQRGTCTFSQKIANAQAAGASGVLIFNEGNTPARSVAFSGSLSSVPPIPVGFIPTADGVELYNDYNDAIANSTALPNVSLSVQGFEDPNRTDWNVIAESKGGDPNHVVVVDAHLDAIYGAGMLDNASGSVTILDIAQQMRHVQPRNKLRFIWFGGEELGELGSTYYVNNLSASDLAKIGYDLDADVTATPNYSIGVLDPAAVDLFGRTVSETFPPNVYAPSLVARDQGVAYFDSIGKNHIFFSPVGTDAEQFNLAGIPASGVLTGQDCCKLQEEVDLFGGYTGNYEGNVPSTDGGCVDNPFRWCDNLANNDPNVLTFMSRGFANMVVNMAFDTSVLTRTHGHSPHSAETSSPARGSVTH
jgi:peptidase M28-like protein/PA domain-containing protein